MCDSICDVQCLFLHFESGVNRADNSHTEEPENRSIRSLTGPFGWADPLSAEPTPFCEGLRLGVFKASVIMLRSSQFSRPTFFGAANDSLPYRNSGSPRTATFRVVPLKAGIATTPIGRRHYVFFTDRLSWLLYQTQFKWHIVSKKSCRAVVTAWWGPTVETPSVISRQH